MGRFTLSFVPDEPIDDSLRMTLSVDERDAAHRYIALRGTGVAP